MVIMLTRLVDNYKVLSFVELQIIVLGHLLIGRYTVIETLIIMQNWNKQLYSRFYNPF